MNPVQSPCYLEGVRAAHQHLLTPPGPRVARPPDWQAVAPEYAREATGYDAYCWITGFQRTWDYIASRDGWPESAFFPKVQFRREQPLAPS